VRANVAMREAVVHEVGRVGTALPKGAHDDAGSGGARLAEDVKTGGCRKRARREPERLRSPALDITFQGGEQGSPVERSAEARSESRLMEIAQRKPGDDPFTRMRTDQRRAISGART
jgi:hypothetical protein